MVYRPPPYTQNMPGLLYVVATPIGNLEDITYRAVRVLGEADLIACEDTRQTRKLLDHYGIHKPTISYHDHNEAERTEELAARLLAGAVIALVSDAGMPLVSDPGYRLVHAAIEAGIAVHPIPGPSASLTALAASGLPTDAFHFGGFLPPKPGQRANLLEALAEEQATLIFYEAPHRILESLEAIETVAGAAAGRGGARTDQDPRGVSARHGGRDPRATGSARRRQGRDHPADRQGPGAAARRHARRGSRGGADRRRHAAHGRHQAGGAPARTFEARSVRSAVNGDGI